jgi:uncharacterized cupin superfamily protein
MGKVNEADLDWTTVERDGAAWRRKQLSAAAGGEDLGCSLYELPPGRRAWPYHYHTANAEALFVLDGHGSLRLAGETESLEPGDYVAFPADERGAHRVINDADEPLRFLVVATMNEPDVTVYPDSEKFGVYVGGAPGDSEGRTLEGYYRIADDVDYWSDEE